MRFIVNIQREKESRMISCSRSEDMSQGTCFDIQTSANAWIRIISKHVALDWYLPIRNSRSLCQGIGIVSQGSCIPNMNALPPIHQKILPSFFLMKRETDGEMRINALYFSKIAKMTLISMGIIQSSRPIYLPSMKLMGLYFSWD